MARVLGLGGVFFKAADPHALAQWYKDVLGFPVEDWPGAIFQLADSAGRDAFAVWSPFKADTTYFQPSTKDFMINFRVDDLDGMVERIEAKGGRIVKRDDQDGNGRFAWVLDPDGNNIELWEPKGPV